MVIILGLILGFIFRLSLGEVGYVIPHVGPAAVKSLFLPIIIFEARRFEAIFLFSPMIFVDFP